MLPLLLCRLAQVVPKLLPLCADLLTSCGFFTKNSLKPLKQPTRLASAIVSSLHTDTSFACRPFRRALWSVARGLLRILGLRGEELLGLWGLWLRAVVFDVRAVEVQSKLIIRALGFRNP